MNWMLGWQKRVFAWSFSAWAACSGATGGTDMSANGSTDLAGVVSTDLAGGGGGGRDLAVGQTGLNFNWHLLTANISGSLNNGFSASCGNATPVDCSDPGSPGRTVGAITMLEFTLKSQAAGGASTTVTVPCPAGNNAGTGTIALPDPTGPYTLTGRALGVAYPTGYDGSSTRVDLVSTDSVGIQVYACGCNQSGC